MEGVAVAMGATVITGTDPTVSDSVPHAPDTSARSSTTPNSFALVPVTFVIMPGMIVA